MGSPSAILSANHVCPMVTGVVPHVAGPVLSPSAATVLISNMPAVGSGSTVVCTGPPDSVAMGSPTVLAGNIPLARLGDSCAHGGAIVTGAPTVLVA